VARKIGILDHFEDVFDIAASNFVPKPDRRAYEIFLDKHGVEVRLSTRATVDELAGFDEVVLATGVTPRLPDIPGIDHPKVLSYAQALTGAPVGKSVAVVGAGGIGFDVSEFLLHEGESPSMAPERCSVVPGPAEPYEYFPGLARSSAISSGTLVTGRSLLTISRLGSFHSPVAKVMPRTS